MIVFNKEHFSSLKLFALLAKKAGCFYHRLGLVEIEREGLKDKGNNELGSVVIGFERLVEEGQLQTQIEIPPK